MRIWSGGLGGFFFFNMLQIWMNTKQKLRYKFWLASCISTHNNNKAVCTDAYVHTCRLRSRHINIPTPTYVQFKHVPHAAAAQEEEMQHRLKAHETLNLNLVGAATLWSASSMLYTAVAMLCIDTEPLSHDG